MVIGICDDNKTDRMEAEGVIKKSEVVRAGEFSIKCFTPEDLIMSMEEELFKYDLLVMDIEFGNEEYNGISLSKRINQIAPLCQIIYLTDFLEFAPEVYETEHCYFVLKRNVEVMLPLALKKAYKIYERGKKHEFIEFASKGKKKYLPIREIICIRREGRVLHIYTSKEEYQCYQSLKVISSKCGKSMVRCHASYIVNLYYVRDYGRERILLSNDMQVPIGRTYQEQIKHAYLNYWIDRM